MTSVPFMTRCLRKRRPREASGTVPAQTPPGSTQIVYGRRSTFSRLQGYRTTTLDARALRPQGFDAGLDALADVVAELGKAEQAGRLRQDRLTVHGSALCQQEPQT